MPWLDKDKVLFIHVPRCGGTSITKHHRVGKKAQKGKNLYYRVGIMYYYYRYKLLENANFPVFTIENLIVLLQITVAFLVFFFVPGFPLPFVMWTMASITFLTSTIIWTAPITMRTDFLRNFLMVLQGKILCGFGGDTEWLIGTTTKGYLFHLTAERCIRYGYVSEDTMKRTSFSIVRNPYSRAVSMYEYNKRFFESFESFMKDFHRRGMKHYHHLHQTDSKDIYCHILPMNAYTHMNGKQIVNTIIKQEQLKRLMATEWQDSGVPEAIRTALTGIPHANARKKKVTWQQYFTQETMDLVLEMYESDFDIFGYDRTIPGRPDLIPKLERKAPVNAYPTSQATSAGTLIRQSVSIPDEQVKVPLPVVHEEPVLSPSDLASMILNEKNKIPRRKSGRQVSIADRVDYVIQEEAAESEEANGKRATSTAGERTSEGSYSPSDEGEKYLEKSLSSTVPRTMSAGNMDEAERDLFRKKRSASAFVLNVG